MNLDLKLIEYRDRLKISKSDSNATVFDPIRKRYVQLTPEEFVRQLFILYLLEEQGIGIRKIMVEREIMVGDRKKRFDLVILDAHNEPNILIECKSYKEEVNNKVFEQIGHYNLAVKAKYLIITNGMKSYAAQIHYGQKEFTFLNDFPQTDSA